MNRALPEPAPELNDLTRQTIGAAIEVHRHFGPGYLEAIYEEALCAELTMRGVPFTRQVPIEITYKGRPMGQSRLDLLVGDRLVVELKAVPTVLAIHREFGVSAVQ